MAPRGGAGVWRWGGLWLAGLGTVALLLWVPIIVGLRGGAAIGCPRGAAENPLSLFGFVATGGAMAAPAGPAPGTESLAGKHLQIVIESGLRRLYLFVDGAEYASWPVAVGTPGTPTPIGHWAIQSKAVWGGAFGARWMRLSIPWGIYGIHGTNNPGSIGYRASHGCVRMRNPDVIELYRLVPVGTPVDIRGPAVARFGEVRRVIVPTLLGSDVLALQRRLQALGMYTGPLDGQYGPQAVAAVRRFQAEHGLPANGVVGYETARSLGLRPLAEDPSLAPTPEGEPVPPPPARAAEVPGPLPAS